MISIPSPKGDFLPALEPRKYGFLIDFFTEFFS